MRITTFAAASQYLQDINSVQDRMNTSMDQLTTGQRINKPSDDPVGTALDLQIRSSISSLKQWQANASDAQSWYSTTESALSNVQTSMQRVRSLVIEANSGTMTQQDLNAIADNIDQMRENIEQVANTKIGDQYIFSGSNNTQAPLTVQTTTNSSGNTVTSYTWNGNNDARNFSLGTNNVIQVNTIGTASFMTAPSGSTQGLLDTLQTISAHLRSGSATVASTFNSDLTNFDANFNNITTQISELGAKQNRVTGMQNQFSQSLTSLQQQLSNVQDANMADVISKFNMQQTVYNAALDTAQHMLLPTLADILK